ncbi:type II toxin-antitoxin system prevent-host-death family antitoxin [Pigmentiphaga soli]|uniref:type II toxin-antitoxin system Phd/YefM family antitoxin n=1 Tax=Pigmentiphaga soli TaxID=1007095 RepID=UPI0031E88E62
MKVFITEATAQMAELIRRAEAGDEIIFTLNGRAAARLAPVVAKPDRTLRQALIQAVRASASAKVSAGPIAARSQDFLYGKEGLPE